MKQTEFDTLVARLEQTARTDPKGYRRRVFLLAMLGYAYIALVVAVVLALLAGLVVVLVATRTAAVLLAKLALPLATLIWITVRAMWVRLEPPVGRPISRKDAPRLFEDAERIARTLKAPIPDVVLVTSELNASVSQVPRLGIFGWPRNYLVIGLQLASALHPDYFLAVLAHEFAHLSRAHGHFAGWIYRLRRTWAQLVDALERDRHVGTVIFSKFFNWYAPYFAAYSFVLAREYEYEADRLAASIVGPRDMAGARSCSRSSIASSMGSSGRSCGVPRRVCPTRRQTRSRAHSSPRQRGRTRSAMASGRMPRFRSTPIRGTRTRR